MRIVSSFSDNKKDDDRPNPRRYADIYAAINPICKAALPKVGITTTSAYSWLCRRRHKHDLRHSFAVSTLLDWYASDTPSVQARLPWLSTYMGHVEPANTYYYLTATPELLARAASRLEPILKGL